MATGTLELFDGVTILDLVDNSNYSTQYTSGLGIPRAPNVPTIAGNTLSAIEYKPRTITMVVDAIGTDQADLTANIAALERMITIAQGRQITRAGTTKVVFTVQQGTDSANDVTYTVLTGSYSLDPSILRDAQIAQKRGRGLLTLVVEAFGKLPTFTMGRKLLHNEIDLPNINYVDIGDGWGPYHTFDGSVTRINCGSDSSIDNIWDSVGYGRIRFMLDSVGAIHGLMTKTVFWNLSVNASGEITFTSAWSGDDGSWVTTDAGLVANVWYMVEWQYDSDATGNDPTFTLSTDGAVGVALTVTEVSTPTGTRDTDAAASVELGITTNFLTGKISEAALFSAASTVDETKPLDGNESNLVAYWPLDEGDGTSTADRQTSGTNTGTITTGAGAWGIDHTPGNAGALLQVRVEDVGGTAWESSKVLYMGTKSGERRTDTVFIAAFTSATELLDPTDGNVTTFTSGATGGRTTNAHGGASSHMTWIADSGDFITDGRVDAGYATYQIAGGALPRGQYQVLARVALEETISAGDFDVAKMQVALGWSQGGKTKTPAAADDKLFTALDQFDLVDMGTITIPVLAVPDGFTSPALDIRIHTIFDQDTNVAWGSGNTIVWSFDYLYLLPIDEGIVIVDAVSATDEILADLISETPGVWKLNTSSVAQQFAVFDGKPIRLSPEATRLYWLKDDTQDPSDIQAYAYLKFTPLVSGV